MNDDWKWGQQAVEEGVVVLPDEATEQAEQGEDEQEPEDDAEVSPGAEALAEFEGKAQEIKETLDRLSGEVAALDADREDRERTQAARDAINEKKAKLLPLVENITATWDETDGNLSPNALRIQAEGVLLQSEITELEQRLPFVGVDADRLRTQLEDIEIKIEKMQAAAESLPEDSAQRRRLERERRSAFNEIGEIEREISNRARDQWIAQQRAEFLERRAREWLTEKARDDLLRAREEHAEPWKIVQAEAAFRAEPDPEELAATMEAITPAVDREDHEAYLRVTLPGKQLPPEATFVPPWAPLVVRTPKDAEAKLRSGEMTVPEALEHLKVARVQRENDKNNEAIQKMTGIKA